MKSIALLLILLCGWISPNTFARSIIMANEGPEYPPFSFHVNGNPFVKGGFEIDLGQALCSRLPSPLERCEVIHRYEKARTPMTNNGVVKAHGLIDWGDLLPGLNARSKSRGYPWDVVISTVAIREDRKEIYDFSNVYLVATKYFFSHLSLQFDQDGDGIISELEFYGAIRGKIIGVEAGTAFVEFAKFLQASENSIQIVEFSSDAGGSAVEKMLGAITAKSIDLSPFDLPVFEVLREKYPQVVRVGPELTRQAPGGKIIGGGDVGMVFRKGSSLRKHFDRALKLVIQDCTYARIHFEHFRTVGELSPAHCQAQIIAGSQKQD